MLHKYGAGGQCSWKDKKYISKWFQKGKVRCETEEPRQKNPRCYMLKNICPIYVSRKACMSNIVQKYIYLNITFCIYQYLKHICPI